MGDKIASGAWHEGGPGAADGEATLDAEAERLKSKRDNARWNIVVGVALMFMAGFHVGFALGGVVMVVYGSAATLYWGRRHQKAKGDPWAYDPELDGPERPEEIRLRK